VNLFELMPTAHGISSGLSLRSKLTSCALRSKRAERMYRARKTIPRIVRRADALYVIVRGVSSGTCGAGSDRKLVSVDDEQIVSVTSSPGVDAALATRACVFTFRKGGQSHSRKTIAPVTASATARAQAPRSTRSWGFLFGMYALPLSHTTILCLHRARPYDTETRVLFCTVPPLSRARRALEVVGVADRGWLFREPARQSFTDHCVPADARSRPPIKCLAEQWSTALGDASPFASAVRRTPSYRTASERPHLKSKMWVKKKK